MSEKVKSWLIAFIVTLIIFFLGWLGYFCETKSNETSQHVFDKVLGGKHELRKFNVKSTTSTTASAWYFLVAGGYSQNTHEKCTIRFYFKNYRGEYQFYEGDYQRIN